MTTHHLLSEQYRSRLVEELQRKGTLTHPHVAEAFRRVPRERFVQACYDRPPGHKTWDLWTPERQDWLATIYQDRALVTQLSGEIPTSSSSMPSIMAQMLEALDVQPGQRVLEIGTGTGYNAALLSLLTHDPTLVTSIDIDRKLVERARQALEQVAEGVFVDAHDGRLGEASRAPYERIIVTASAGGLPKAWVRQLAPGGRLVMPLQGSLGESGFLVIDKASTGEQARGTFLDLPLAFMSLRSQQQPSPPGVRSLFQEPITGQVQLTPEHPFPALFDERLFRWWTQWWWPGLRLQKIFPAGQHTPLLLLLDHEQRTILQLTQRADGSWHGGLHGSFPLWETMEHAIADCSQQPKSAYWIAITEHQALLTLPPHLCRDIFSW